MKIAIIDLGTNTFHLLIAEVRGEKSKIIYKTNVPVRLGGDITKDNLIVPKAFERGISCLKHFNSTIREHGVKHVKAVATSGVRSAKNGQEFVDSAKMNACINIDVIDGDKEADLIYRGVKWSGAISDLSLIIDIGGGSTEFILCTPQDLIWKKSYNIGAARLMQSFFKSDPIESVDQQRIKTHLQTTLSELIVICNTHKPTTLIGSAGAFETFAELIYPQDDIQSKEMTLINLTAFHELSSKLIKSNHLERSTMKGLIPLRVDMIVMASLLTNYVLELADFKSLKLATYDLKMGALSAELAKLNGGFER